MSQIKLYSYFRSSCSARVRIALQLKGIEYEYIPIHLVNGQQNSEEFLKVNPQGKVPALIIDDQIITQSFAILEYLEEKYPEYPLLPKDLIDRAKVRSLCLSIVADIQPIQNFGVLNKVGDTKVDWAHYFISKGFDILEKELKDVSGVYSFGDNITLADLCLYPQVYNALRFNVDMSLYPTIYAIYQRLEKVEAFIKADWKNQPDTPEDLKSKA